MCGEHEWGRREETKPGKWESFSAEGSNIGEQTDCSVLATAGVSGIKLEKAMTIELERPWLIVPQRKSVRRPAHSTINQETVVKMT